MWLEKAKAARRGKKSERVLDLWKVAGEREQSDGKSFNPRLLTPSLPVITQSARSLVLENTFCVFTVKSSEAYPQDYINKMIV